MVQTLLSDDATEDDEPPGAGELPPAVADTVRTIGRSTRRAVVYGSGILFNLIGLYFGFGLVLNLTGYAYSFSFKDGYKIDTIENRRTQIQFERESRRYDSEKLRQQQQQQPEQATASRLAVEAVGRAEAPAE